MNKLKLVDRIILATMAVLAAACTGLGLYTFVHGYWQMTVVFGLILICVAFLSYDVVAMGNIDINRFYDKNLKEQMKCLEK